MPTKTPEKPKTRHGLENQGLDPKGKVHWNLSVPDLYERAMARGEGRIVAGGGFAAVTSPHTGRSPNDKFVVREPSSEKEVWWGKVNRPMEAAQFDALHQDMLASLAGKELFALDCYAGADPTYRLAVATQNVGYNQPPHTGFYLGFGTKFPVRRPNIVTPVP